MDDKFVKIPCAKITQVGLNQRAVKTWYVNCSVHVVDALVVAYARPYGSVYVLLGSPFGNKGPSAYQADIVNNKQ